MSHLAKQNDHDAERCTWATPVALFAELHREFDFTVDAAAQAHNAKLPRYWSAYEDGLLQDWSKERVFCNPPYSHIAPWVDKANLSVLSVLLVPARTDCAWFQKAMLTAAEIHFFVGRIQFEAPRGIEASSNAEGSVLLVFKRGSTDTEYGVRDSKTGRRIQTPAPQQRVLPLVAASAA